MFYTNVLTYKGRIYLRGIDENNEPFKEIIKYEPYLFINSDDSNSEYKTIHGQSVKKKDFRSISEARKYMNQFDDVEGHTIYGLPIFEYLYINDIWPNGVEFDPQLISIVSLDIETKIGETDIATAVQTAPNEVTAITLSKDGKFYTFGTKDYVKHKDNVTYVKCKDEVDLLEKFLRAWEHLNPDAITGWNIEFFDIPYLINRLRHLLGEAAAKSMSPWGIITPYTVEIKGQKVDTYKLEGIANLDYIQLYKKFIFVKPESYALDHIAYIELDEQKLDYSEYSNLDEMYEKNPQKYYEYNIHDTYLVNELEAKLKLIELVFAMAYDSKVNYQDTMTTVRQWDVIIHNYLLKKKIVIPPLSVSSGTVRMGGYVKEPQVGGHDWVVSFDLNSLYPHLIQQYNISPDSFVKQIDVPSVDRIISGETIPDEGYSVAANGTCYTKKHHGFLAELMEMMYEDRKAYKKKMIEAKKRYEETKDPEILKEISKWDNMQQAKKIQLNSAYGALGNKYFRWFDTRFAEAITLSGQLAIKWVSKDLNDYLNKILKTNNKDYVIANDTDSCYITLNELVKKILPEEKDEHKISKFLDKVCEEKLQEVIDDSYKRMAERMHAYAQRMFMKREAIANKAIWVAKKRYILNVYDQEGVAFEEPKIKMSGIEAVRSSTPQVCRDKIKESLKIVMNKDELSIQKYIREFKEEFKKMSFVEVAFPRGISNLSGYQTATGELMKGTPIHVRGSLLYNSIIDRLNLGTKYEKIGNGEKIKFCYLLQPNPYGMNVIAAPSQLPPEFGLDKYIDYDTQFEKAYLAPISSILETIGWSSEKRSTLEAFFV